MKMPMTATTTATTEAANGVPATPNSSFHPKAPATVKAFAQVATTTQLALHEIPAQKVSHSQKPGALMVFKSPKMDKRNTKYVTMINKATAKYKFT
mmetsp:Transcript_58480/g.92668  ORF Transcript_58480/g.92668 Transcript_58480/m.92668 type:complete len:96 (+) Transcript_58480:459-746(+)